MASLKVEPLEIEVVALSQPNSPKLPITPKPASKVLSEHSVLLHPEQEKIVAQPRREHRVRLAPEISEVDTPTYPNSHQKLYRIRSDLILAFRNLYNLEKRVYRLLKSRTRCNSFCIALLFVLVIPIALLSVFALIYYFHYF